MIFLANLRKNNYEKLKKKLYIFSLTMDGQYGDILTVDTFRQEPTTKKNVC